ncbi:uncharacterized protein LOC124935289 [Impatiens glandulifera]|uniref:uncharacterized protein LOC124935289 n=1 Tax=Impatiens glandulifera TaxID=253017 RepID=UPI001FB08514|nr:uncharacterized protein LOC124935289 [Impatiens glandulifera]
MVGLVVEKVEPEAHVESKGEEVKEHRLINTKKVVRVDVELLETKVTFFVLIATRCDITQHNVEQRRTSLLRRRYLDQEDNICKRGFEPIGMLDCNSREAPMEHRAQLHKDSEGQPIDATEYRRVIVCLCYLLHTRTYLSYDVGVTSRFIEMPTEIHHKAVKQMTGKVLGGMTFYINDSLVSWNSQKQKLVALFTCEVDFMVVATTTCMELWLKSLFFELSGSKSKAAKLYVDNKSALTLIK